MGKQRKQPSAKPIGNAISSNPTCNNVADSTNLFQFLYFVQHRVWPMVRRAGYDLNNTEIWALCALSGYTHVEGRDLVGLAGFFKKCVVSPFIRTKLRGALEGLRVRGYVYTVQSKRFELWGINDLGNDAIQAHNKAALHLQQCFTKPVRVVKSA